MGKIIVVTYPKPDVKVEIKNFTIGSMYEGEPMQERIESADGFYYGCVKVPTRNRWGQEGRDYWIHVYQAEEELLIEQWC